MSIVKSSWNGASAFGLGKRRVSTKNSGGANTKRSPFNRGGKVSARSDNSHQMHTRISPKKGAANVIQSRHPDAVPRLNFLHMN